jgi:hypothetical protein
MTTTQKPSPRTSKRSVAAAEEKRALEQALETAASGIRVRRSTMPASEEEAKPFITRQDKIINEHIARTAMMTNISAWMQDREVQEEERKIALEEDYARLKAMSVEVYEKEKVAAAEYQKKKAGLSIADVSLPNLISIVVQKKTSLPSLLGRIGNAFYLKGKTLAIITQPDLNFASGKTYLPGVETIYGSNISDNSGRDRDIQDAVRNFDYCIYLSYCTFKPQLTVDQTRSARVFYENSKKVDSPLVAGKSFYLPVRVNSKRALSDREIKAGAAGLINKNTTAEEIFAILTGGQTSSKVSKIDRAGAALFGSGIGGGFGVLPGLFVMGLIDPTIGIVSSGVGMVLGAFLGSRYRGNLRVDNVAENEKRITATNSTETVSDFMWVKSEKRFNTVMSRWFEYEIDILKMLDAPLLVDHSCDQTAEFIRAMTAAKDLKESVSFYTDKSAEQEVAKSEFVEAVTQMEMKFNAAENHALARGMATFNESEQRKMILSRQQFVMSADTSASEHERDQAFKQAVKNLEGVLRIKPEARVKMLESVGLTGLIEQ